MKIYKKYKINYSVRVGDGWADTSRESNIFGGVVNLLSVTDYVSGKEIVMTSNLEKRIKKEMENLNRVDWVRSDDGLKDYNVIEVAEINQA